MSRNPSKLVFAMAALLAVWVAVFWLYKPRTGVAGQGGISYGETPDLARALVETGGVRNGDRPGAVATPVVIAPLPVAPLPGQAEPPSAAPTTSGKPRVVAPEFSEYTVQKGDTSFAAISRRVFGSAKHGDAISRANPFVTPDKLFVGRTRLRIPKDPTNIQGRVEGAETELARAGEGSEARTHEVQAGETLGAISKRYYGTAGRWKAILDANSDQFDRPERVKTGMTIRIPNLD